MIHFLSSSKRRICVANQNRRFLLCSCQCDALIRNRRSDFIVSSVEMQFVNKSMKFATKTKNILQCAEHQHEEKRQTTQKSIDRHMGDGEMHCYSKWSRDNQTKARAQLQSITMNASLLNWRSISFFVFSIKKRRRKSTKNVWEEKSQSICLGASWTWGRSKCLARPMRLVCLASRSRKPKFIWRETQINLAYDRSI